jgi:signal transduction histidine kinase
MINPDLKNSNILIVDDQIANVEVLEDFLLIQGYKNIKSTMDAREVVKLYLSFKPDLILLDLSMPYFTGFEVMEQLKSIISNDTYFPILVLTADISPEAKQQALSGGAYDFLTKPFNLVEVGLRIKNLLFTSYLQQQLHYHNQLLAEKVKDRTVELEFKNLELNAAKEKAEASDRLKAAFLLNISHEIRTPLNGIVGFAGLLENPKLEAASRKLYVKMMNESSDRLIATITEYVDMALIVSGNLSVKKSPVNVSALLKEIQSIFEEKCQAKNLAFNLAIPLTAADCTIQTDEALLSKVLIHLMDNAVKFTNEGAVNVGFSSNAETVEIFVKDTGIGIETSAGHQVFDVFMQEDISGTRPFDGSGLGLSIVKGFAKYIGGQVKFESEKGKGTAFFLSLPIE